MKSKFLDVVGVSAATLCLIHCIVFPFLLIAPFGLSHHPAIDLFFLVVGTVVVFRVTNKIKFKSLKFLFWISILLIAISVGLDIIFHLHTYIIFIGAAGLITAHVINYKNHRSDDDHI